MPAIDANGITIEYESRGDGEPLLLVMGLGGQLIDWPDEFVDGLVAAGFRVITFDNRDIGLSTEFTWEAPSQVKAVLRSLARRKVKSEYRLTDMAADAVGLLDALGVESAHVVGISMGGMIAQTIAIEHPGRVRSLTSIMSHTGDRRHGKIALKLLPKLARLRCADPRDGDRAVGDDVPVGLGPALRRVRATSAREARVGAQLPTRGQPPVRPPRSWPAPTARPGLRRVKVPTLVVHGLVDPLVRAERWRRHGDAPCPAPGSSCIPTWATTCPARAGPTSRPRSVAPPTSPPDAQPLESPGHEPLGHEPLSRTQRLRQTQRPQEGEVSAGNPGAGIYGRHCDRGASK